MEKNTSKLNETAKTPAKKSKKPAKSKKPEKTVSAKKLPGIFKKHIRKKHTVKTFLKNFISKQIKNL